MIHHGFKGDTVRTQTRFECTFSSFPFNHPRHVVTKPPCVSIRLIVLWLRDTFRNKDADGVNDRF